MEAANINPKYKGVHIWLNRKKLDSFELKVTEDIYNLFNDWYTNQITLGPSGKYWDRSFEVNARWSSNGTATYYGFGDYDYDGNAEYEETTTQSAQDVVNLLQGDTSATYGRAVVYYRSQKVVCWLYTKLLTIGTQCGYGFSWTWVVSFGWDDENSILTPYNQYETALRYFKQAWTETGLGPGAYALWLQTGRPSTDLFTLFKPYLNEDTLNYKEIEIPSNWRGYSQ